MGGVGGRDTGGGSGQRRPQEPGTKGGGNLEWSIRHSMIGMRHHSATSEGYRAVSYVFTSHWKVHAASFVPRKSAEEQRLTPFSYYGAPHAS
jgi:hypothetical protein